MNSPVLRYLVIGANSFLAKEIILRLYKNNFVVGVYHEKTNNLVNGITNIKIEELQLLQDNFDVVFYISAYIPKKGEFENNNLLSEVNVELPEVICNKFKKARIIYASSVSVFGDNNGMLCENSALAPVTQYARSKVEGESIIRQHSNYGIIRISSMYGIGMKLDTFIPQIINMAIKNKRIKLFGIGERMQNYIHVSDVAEFFIGSSRQYINNAYLAVGVRSYSNSEIASIISSYLDNVDIKFEGDDFSNSFRYNAQFTYNSLGVIPKININDGISELIKWQQKEF